MNSSITPGRCDLAPEAIRKALVRHSLYDADAHVDLSAVAVTDRGDVDLTGKSPEESVTAIREFIGHDAGCTILLGGDNGVTRPGVHSLGVPLERCALLTFDAHHDLRDLDSGLTNGNPVRALLRDGLPGANVVQIGIQPFANSAAYARIARQQGITVVTADEVHAAGIHAVLPRLLDELSGKAEAIYIDLDVDVLDRAFAPACPGSRPGGLQPWMMRRAARICGQHERVRMIDIVEIDPTNDIADCTCLAAASFLLAFASGFASRSRQ